MATSSSSFPSPISPVSAFSTSDHSLVPPVKQGNAKINYKQTIILASNHIETKSYYFLNVFWYKNEKCFMCSRNNSTVLLRPGRNTRTVDQ
ncbi:hypothetical protein VNO78_08434 [Psophocarpus tetragonolobus]|uniref:Uncharacterized protein n=1 Tax=Psophocarpus tetragonolobus TaxID=3891 RepID=A0AAN9SX68_PSOTE